MAIGDVRVIHGDCLAVLPTLAGEPIAAVVTDPPYGLGDSLNKGGGTWGEKYRGATPWDYSARQEWIDSILALEVPSIIWGGHCYRVPPARGWLVWRKYNAVPTMSKCELAWTNLDCPTQEFESPVLSVDRVHPTQKPISLMLWCLGRLGLPPGSLVLDPFAGSGTTGVACLKAGLRCILIEKDERYIPVIERRIAEARTPLFDSIEAGEGA